MSQFPALTAAPATPTGFANLGYSLLTGAAASITFSGIDTTYKEFIVLAWMRHATNGDALTVRINSDSGANYDRQGFSADGVTVTNRNATARTAVDPDNQLGVSSASGQHYRMNIYKNAAALEGMAFTLEGGINFGGPSITANMNATRWNNVADLISALQFLAGTGGNNFSANTMVSVFGLVP